MDAGKELLAEQVSRAGQMRTTPGRLNRKIARYGKVISPKAQQRSSQTNV